MSSGQETSPSGLDPGIARLLAEAGDAAADTRSWSELSPAEARERCRNEIAITSGRGAQDVASRDLTIFADGLQIRLRIYQPVGLDSEPPSSVVVYIHGGGFVLGDLDTHDAICRDLVAAGRFVCVAIDYRLSPEHLFPAALDDCVESLQWVQHHTTDLGVASPRRSLAGDSAGGNLAAAACLVLRDRGLSLPQFQLLVYPALDLSMSTDSAKAFGPEYGLSTEDLAWFYGKYLGADADAGDPYVSPYLAPDLSGLPPAHIVTVGYDPLRDEGLGYAASLRGAGVPTSSRHYPGLIHGTLELAAVVPAGRELLEDVALKLAQV